MIMQAIIEKINQDGTCYVNIPNYSKLRNLNKNNIQNEGYLAHFVTLPNCAPNASVGDRVYVGFLNNNSGEPIILGHMYFQNPDISAKTDSTYSAMFSDLEVNATTTLPESTTIRNISSTEIKYLEGLRANIQKQLDILSEKIDSISSGSTPIDSD